VNQIKSLQQEIEKCASGIGQLMKLEKELEDIDAQHLKSPTSATKPPDEKESGVQFWSQEMANLQSGYLTTLANWDPNIVLRPVRITELEEM